MTAYPMHTLDSAPEASLSTLRHVQATLGRVPGLAAAMAESPSLLRAFFAVREIYAQGTLGAADREVLSIANAVENGCRWCVAFHTMVARASGVSPSTVEALRARRAPDDPRARALSDFTRALVRGRGAVPAETLAAFRAAGFTAAEALDVVLGVAFSTMANYAQHLVDAPLDAQIAAHAWDGAGDA